MISVILPVYNAEKYLGEAIDSLLNQSYSNFELLIYNDGSTDASLEIIQSYKDDRIVVKNFTENIGLIKLLNLAFLEAKGTYIARMDADDISYINRFEAQIKYLEENPECGICGTQSEVIGSLQILKKPTQDIDLRWWIFKGSPLAHPSIMLRTDLLRKYNLSFKSYAYVVEDFDLWWRMAFHTQMANLPEVLLKYRVHKAQESSAKQSIQANNFRLSQAEFMSELGLSKPFCDPVFMDNLLSKNIQSKPKIVFKVWKLFGQMKDSPTANQFFGRENIELKCQEEMSYLLKNLKFYNWNLIPLALNQQFGKFLQKANISVWSLLIKSIINWKTR